MIAPPKTWETATAVLMWRQNMPLAEAGAAVASFKAWCQMFGATRRCSGCGREIYVPAALASSLSAQFGRTKKETQALHRALDVFAFAFLAYDTDSCEPDGPHLCHWCAWERDED